MLDRLVSKLASFWIKNDRERFIHSNNVPCVIFLIIFYSGNDWVLILVECDLDYYTLNRQLLSKQEFPQSLSSVSFERKQKIG